jgi:replication fork clamp-binding protein CrfC
LDPEGKRTIGVITKIDIMDRGTNAKNMIMGKDVQLRLGYVGVKNRSQEDINNSMGVISALEAEKIYFSKHPVYSTMPQNVLGTEALTQKLSTVMFHHIRAFLPKIIKEISEKVKG